MGFPKFTLKEQHRMDHRHGVDAYDELRRALSGSDEVWSTLPATIFNSPFDPVELSSLNLKANQLLFPSLATRAGEASSKDNLDKSVSRDTHGNFIEIEDDVDLIPPENRKEHHR